MCITYYVNMANVTMSVDEALLKRARKLAVDRDTTVSELFRDHLASLVERDDTRREFLADELDSLFAASTASSGGSRVNRDALYDR